MQQTDARICRIFSDKRIFMHCLWVPTFCGNNFRGLKIKKNLLSTITIAWMGSINNALYHQNPCNISLIDHTKYIITPNFFYKEKFIKNNSQNKSQFKENWASKFQIKEKWTFYNSIYVNVCQFTSKYLFCC